MGAESEGKMEMPFCGATGRKWITPFRSKMHGKRHIRLYHDKRNFGPIIEYKK